MDIDLIRSILTVVIFVTFIGIWIWAWGEGRKQDFERSAALPLEDDTAIDNEREKV